MTLWFDMVNSTSLSEEDKELIMSRLETRISKHGVLRVVAQQSRSQADNRELAVERFAELLLAVVTPARRRKKI